MKDGFLKVAVSTPETKVANVKYNTQLVIDIAHRAAKEGIKVLALPELVLSTYCIGDLLFQQKVISSVEEGLARIIRETAELDMLIALGLPVTVRSKLFNCVAVIAHGELLGIVPKTYLPNYSEFTEMRQFFAAPETTSIVPFAGFNVPFGTKLLFACREMPELIVAAEICEDIWVSAPPSVAHAKAGATVLINASASPEMVGKVAFRRDLVRMQSSRVRGAYMYANVGRGESGDGVISSGHCLIAEDGTVLAEAKPFTYPEITSAVIDLNKINTSRRRSTSYVPSEAEGYFTVPFSLSVTDTELTVAPTPTPFVPDDKAELADRCELILNIQAHGLASRLARTHAKSAVIGVSGGLDSTLALLVAARATDLCGMPRSAVSAVTMPGFGTTGRTKSNAEKLSESLGATLRTVDIRESVRVHFNDIGHDQENQNVVYENAQARERTQVLMDIANAEGGIVVGTGDLSELALGWATFNGDHMSMYGVNSGVPKTLIRHIVRWYAEDARASGNGAVADVLFDVLDIPVSPELLPPKDGEIAQCTENIVGPYELHDYFLYHLVRHCFSPEKILRLAKMTFAGVYTPEELKKWLGVFVRRFFTQQFKRSCHPDGPKVGPLCFGEEWHMPSDADSALWMEMFEESK